MCLINLPPRKLRQAKSLSALPALLKSWWKMPLTQAQQQLQLKSVTAAPPICVLPITARAWIRTMQKLHSCAMPQVKLKAKKTLKVYQHWVFVERHFVLLPQSAPQSFSQSSAQILRELTFYIRAVKKSFLKAQAAPTAQQLLYETFSQTPLQG